MHRFFIDPSNITSSEAAIIGPECHHIRKVLRLVPGEEVVLLDGKGNIYLAAIKDISKNKINTTILKSEKAELQPPFVHLGIALLKGAKMDLVLQKTTELGVNTISPFKSQYCVAHEKKVKLDRWRRITFESCKQCGRPIPPELKSLQSFDDLLRIPEKKDKKIIFWEKEKSTNLHEVIKPSSNVHSVFIIIGPEGGFSDYEISLAQNAGFQSVTLGKRILRAETAAIAAISILQFQLGNLDRHA